MPSEPERSLDFRALRNAYASGLAPRHLIDEVERRIATYADPALFLSRPKPSSLAARASQLGALDARTRNSLPLFGMPFVVKDNIDVAGMPTTAACPEFTYTPARSAAVVERLEAAGAILIGKANLDQFAAGLVGVRSPYGIPRNPFDARIIPGGSSSGSATAVAAGLAAFSLGTDTAGSGRIPAGLNNLVGLKPTPGLVSTRGVVPACRTLDCVSIFALTTDDAFDVLKVVAGFDAEDAFSADIKLGNVGARPTRVRIGVPRTKDRLFFGDIIGAAAFDAALLGLAADNCELVELDFEPLFDVARLLYDGPWVAERYAAIEAFLIAQPQALHPVTRSIIAPAAARTAVDAFKATYQLMEARRKTAATWKAVDALAVPTVPRAWTIAEVAADPIKTNSALGTYTNFVNLLGMSALAFPVALRSDGFPSGITLIGPGGHDAWLASVGRHIEGTSGLALGATRLPRPVPVPARALPRSGMIPIVVIGAHMSGLPLNRELVDNGAVFVEATATAPVYRLFALTGGPPRRPGLVRVLDGGAAIAAEVWALPPDGFGRFVAAIPAPLGVGTIRLADGSAVKGFLCESAGLDGATDITGHGGWRAFLASTVT